MYCTSTLSVMANEFSLNNSMPGKLQTHTFTYAKYLAHMLYTYIYASLTQKVTYISHENQYGVSCSHCSRQSAVLRLDFW